VTVRHRIFESSTKAWAALCTEAEQFATDVGRQRLINISVAASGGSDLFGAGGHGVVIVWYWDESK
jgi:hypothetical protein